MSDEQKAPPPGALQAVIAVAVLVPLVAAYMLLGNALGIASIWAGFLFLLYWSGIHQADIKAFWPDLCGSVAGVGVAFLCHWLPPQGAAGGIAVLVVVMGSIYMLVRQQVAIIFNLGLMLFLTVGTIPAVGASADHVDMLLGVLLGAAYGGGILWIVTRIAAMRAAKVALASATVP